MNNIAEVAKRQGTQFPTGIIRMVRILPSAPCEDFVSISYWYYPECYEEEVEHIYY